MDKKNIREGENEIWSRAPCRVKQKILKIT